jgi:hypothetical protein
MRSKVGTQIASINWAWDGQQCDYGQDAKDLNCFIIFNLDNVMGITVDVVIC